LLHDRPVQSGALRERAWFSNASLYPTPRWLHQFDNFTSACALLSEAMATRAAHELNTLEREGVVQRFEYTWELAWKVLKDYLDHTGVVLDTVTPASVVRAAFAANLIADGEAWLRALDARNRMSNTYSAKACEAVVDAIDREFLALFEALRERLDGLAAVERGGAGDGSPHPRG
jgi:nucleotidyltransferase substrate binding protein (TIGR01987 family)